MPANELVPYIFEDEGLYCLIYRNGYSNNVLYEYFTAEQISQLAAVFSAEEARISGDAEMIEE